MQSLKEVLTAVGTGIALVIVSAVLATGQLPDPGMEIDPENTALVITDPQNDFLSPEGVTWGVVGKSVTAAHRRHCAVTGETGTGKDPVPLWKMGG